MNETLIWLVDALAYINWLEVFQALAAVVTAIIAYAALKNWQRQDKAKREADFLDSLIETSLMYMTEIPKLIQLLEVSKIGMASHVPIHEVGSRDDKAVEGAVAYIKRKGEHDSKRLLDALKIVQPSVIRLRSLAAKGQIFKFKNYANCQKAVMLLTWHFDRIEAFATVIGSSSVNWDHPEVQKQLRIAMDMDPSEMRGSIAEKHADLLEFAVDTYNEFYR